MLKKLLRQRDEEGQGLVEYGLILGLIAVVAIAALNATGTNVNSMLQRVANTLDTVS
ncbi:MAG: Flp family type IVb pilin [Candidatus Riflebacteria bacterium]|nr:Flp family type IVb pilin [Candidatus Riflebacteria bacterium]